MEEGALLNLSRHGKATQHQSLRGIFPTSQCLRTNVKDRYVIKVRKRLLDRFDAAELCPDLIFESWADATT